jgi:hypothetical protein
MQAAAIEWTEWAINTGMFWEPDEKKKARIVRGVHHLFVYAMFTLIIVSHTIYPAFWLQTVVLFVCILVWIQHVLTGGCVVSKVEQKWLGTTESFVDPIVDLFHIKLAEDDDRTGFVTLGSTVAVLFLSLEWVSRLIHMAMGLLSRARQTVSTLMPGIPLLQSSP